MIRLPIVFLLGAWLLGGCQPDGEADDASADDEPRVIPPEEAALTPGVGEWELVKEVSGWTPQVINYDTMKRKTYYRFRADQTFYKYTTRGDTVRGTYRWRQPQATTTDGLRFIELAYPEDYFFYTSCLSGKELFTLRGDTLVNDTQPCDGPKLFYVKR
ncbi:MAG: hypothetical protein WA960_20395 [Tunicatimonas sp.]